MMGLPAFAAYDRGMTSAVFGRSTAPAADVLAFPVAASAQPLKALAANDPGPLRKLETQVAGGRVANDRAIGVAIGMHKDAVRRFGFAGAGDNRTDALFNAGRDGLMLASAAALPVIAPAFSALALADLALYIKADRTPNKARQARGRLEDAFRSRNAPVRPGGETPWHKPGFHAARLEDSAPALRKDEIAYLSGDIAQNRSVQVMLGQQAMLGRVEAANTNRRDKGLPVSMDTVEAALEQDSLRLMQSAGAPMPGHL